MHACMYVSFNNFGVKQSAEYEIMKGDEASISWNIVINGTFMNIDSVLMG